MPSAGPGPVVNAAQPGYAVRPMEQQTSSDAPATGRRLRGLIIAAFVLAAGVFIWNQLPKGSYPTDLSRIGQGQAALVLTMNGNFMAGMEMMPVLDTLRAEFGGQAHFLVASMGLPEGQAFALQNQTADGSVVVFDPRGTRMAVLHGPRTAEELRQALQLALQP
jgi:hypothetical protein